MSWERQMDSEACYLKWKSGNSKWIRKLQINYKAGLGYFISWLGFHPPAYIQISPPLSLLLGLHSVVTTNRSGVFQLKLGSTSENKTVVEGKEGMCTGNFCGVQYVDALIKRIREHIMGFLLCSLLSKDHLREVNIRLRCKKTGPTTTTET